MDTVTLIRSAIRGLLKVAATDLEDQLRAVLAREDDYTAAGKPVCDYDDPDARVALVDALARDGMALLAVLDGRELSDAVSPAAALLATVLGQDLDLDEAGVFRIARRVAPDRVISTVDPDARHGHKTAARGFDGYKGHVATDPDSEIITATEVSAGNTGDASVAEQLINDLLDTAGNDQPDTTTGEDARVYGDNAYGTGEFHDRLGQAGIEDRCKTQPPTAAGGMFGKDRFDIDLDRDAVTCPAGQTVPLRRAKPGRMAYFGGACAGCPLRAQCTNAKNGRTIYVGPYEQQLARARARQCDPNWQADYRATRPKVERKIAHLMRRRHGGRRARVRGRTKVAADFALLAAAVNLARLGVFAVASPPNRGWASAAG